MKDLKRTALAGVKRTALAGVKPTVLAEASSWQAWDKPTGWTVHNEEPSLQAFIKKKSNREVHFLNRLDRETSGIVIVTEFAQAVPNLQKCWQSDLTKKIYVAIHRKPRDFQMIEQIWDEPLSDKSEGRKNPQGLAKDRVPCRTIMRPLMQTEHLVLSVLTLETGRQHQIRKHAALHKMELIGDTRYGDPKYNDRLKNYVTDLRLGLHAAVLIWQPNTGPVAVKSPLPDFFTTLFSEAQAKVEALIPTL